MRISTLRLFKTLVIAVLALTTSVAVVYAQATGGGKQPC